MPVKHYCASCNVDIPGTDTEIGTCPHGLLCNACRYDSQCLQCKRERDGEEILCVCCAHGQHGSHLIGDAACDCMCHASNQRKAAA